MVIKKIVLAISFAVVLTVVPNNSVAMENRVLPLHEILENLGNVSLPLKDRLTLCRPSTIITDVSHLLKAKSCSDTACRELFLTGIFAVHFHIMLTEELPQVLPLFIESLSESKGYKKDLGVNSQQRKVLDILKHNKPSDIKYYLEKGILSQFFSANDQGTKTLKATILSKIGDVDAEIRNEFLKKAGMKGSVFNCSQLFNAINLVSLAVDFGSCMALKVCHDIGLTYMENSQQDQARRWLQKSAENGCFESKYLLGRLSYEKGDTFAAKQWVTEAGNQNHSLSIGLLVAIACKEKDKTSCLKWAKKVEEIGDPEQMYNVGINCHNIGEMPYAIVLLEKTRRHGWHLADFPLGNLYEEQKKIELAMAAYKRAAKSNNANTTSAIYNLGLLYEKTGDLVNAKICYQKVIKHHTAALCSLGTLLAEEGNYLEAGALLEQAARAGHGEALVNLGIKLLKEDKVTQAKPILEQAVKMGLDSAMCSLSACCYEIGDMANALYWGEKAADLNERSALYLYGCLLHLNGNRQECKKWFQKAADMGHPASLYNMGICSQNEGDLNQAKIYYIQAYNKGKNEALIKLAILANNEGDVEDAINYLKEAIKLGVDGAEIHFAKLLTEIGFVQEALDYQEFYEEHNETLGVSQESPEKAAAIPSPEVTDNDYSFSSSIQINEKISTVIPKKLQRFIERAEKKEKRELLEIAVGDDQENKLKTYKDVTVSVACEAQASYEGEHAIKIKYLISALANGDTKRGRFKQLKGHENLYSMRLTKADRLVFEITKGNLKNGVTGLEIISAKGHYKGL